VATPLSSWQWIDHQTSMHHLHTRSAVVPFRLAAFLLVIICLLAPIAVGLLLQSLLTDSPRSALVGSGFVALALVLAIPQWVAGTRTGCPLCWTPVLAPKYCAKHRKARKFMGSHRLRVALAILFKNRFRCPYCNESTAMAQPRAGHHTNDHWAQLD
jgi:hypothetical protein